MSCKGSLFLATLLAILLAVFLAPVSRADDLPPNFALEVIEYIPGTGVGSDWLTGQPYSDPSVALGRPTVDTTGNPIFVNPLEPVPVVPVAPASRSFEIVTIGAGGALTLKFEHPVFDHPQNPFGIDFIVFGNVLQSADRVWSNRSPDVVTLEGTLFEEPGIVSVSQDGETWLTFTNGPFADTFAPTLGRMWQPEAPDASLGEWNDWWGEATDPTWPLDPSITSTDFVGRTVADVARIYGRSAGGTGFDLSSLDLPMHPERDMKWMQYIRIEAPSSPGGTPEIDAVAAVRPVSDYELWKLEQFDWEQRADPMISGDAADGVIAGVPNRLVYAMGLEVADEGLRVTRDPDGLVVSYPRRVGQEALQLHLEHSTDMFAWQALGIGPQLSAVDQGNGTEIMTYRLDPPAEVGAVRLRGVWP